MNSLKHWTKSEKVILHLSILYKNIKIKHDMLLKPSLNKQLIVNKKENNVLLNKYKSCVI